MLLYFTVIAGRHVYGICCSHYAESILIHLGRTRLSSPIFSWMGATFSPPLDRRLLERAVMVLLLRLTPLFGRTWPCLAPWRDTFAGSPQACTRVWVTEALAGCWRSEAALRTSTAPASPELRCGADRERFTA